MCPHVHVLVQITKSSTNDGNYAVVPWLRSIPSCTRARNMAWTTNHLRATMFDDDILSSANMGLHPSASWYLLHVLQSQLATCIIELPLAHACVATASVHGDHLNLPELDWASTS